MEKGQGRVFFGLPTSVRVRVRYKLWVKIRFRFRGLRSTDVQSRVRKYG